MNRRNAPSRLLAQIAASLDVPPSLSRYIRDLMAPLDALGSSPRQIATRLAAAGARPGWRVLDLACGKGSGAIAVARRCRCRVLGVDAFPPFIDEARIAAERAAVEHLCAFEVGDASRLPRSRFGAFDAAMMIGLFPLARAAALLRRAVRPGGIYIIDDTVRVERGPWARAARRWTAVPTLRESNDVIEALGDRVLWARSLGADQGLRRSRAIVARLRRGVRTLVREHPRLATSARHYLRGQERAERLLCGPLRPTIWVVRRG
ncbi:MAG: methyltransferase domain-containing protein [Phycisphaeraceae bacterium]|nr:methyltransferase domain-containing protein [Phycisphaeraceae bacterium]